MLDKDAYEMIATHTSMSTLLEPRMMQTRGGKINMCKAIDIWLAEREAKGISQGISQGLSQGISQGNDETSYKMLNENHCLALRQKGRRTRLTHN